MLLLYKIRSLAVQYHSVAVGNPGIPSGRIATFNLTIFALSDRLTQRYFSQKPHD